MLDYRIHYAVMQAEDLLRPNRRPELTLKRGVHRVFRLGGRGGERQARRR